MGLTFEELRAKPALMDVLRTHFLKRFHLQLRAQYVAACRRTVRAEEELERLRESKPRPSNTNTTSNANTNTDNTLSGRMAARRRARTDSSESSSDSKQPQR